MFDESWDEPSPTTVTTSVQYSGQSQGYSSACRSDRNFDRKSDNRGQREWRRNNDRSRGRSNSDWRGSDNRGRSDNELVMRVEGSKIGMIIGRQGSKIRELSENSGAKIKIGQPCEDDDYFTEVILTGSEESRKKCQELIDDLVGKKVAYEYGDSFKREDSVPLIDWDAVNQKAMIAEKKQWEHCPPITKNFYIEEPEVANLTAERVKAIRDKDTIVVNAMSEEDVVPNPVTTFAQAFSHYPDIMREIEKQGFTVPSPIQSQAWPILLSGKDLIGIAQTGTGKTLAFLLPALIHIDGQDLPRESRGGPNVLVIAPTRELALQIESEVKKYSYKGIKCVCIYGGGSRRDQIKHVTSGTEIIIATPGRLNDLVEARVINLSSITYIVLDEADRMLDMGFEPQIRKVLLDIRPDRQSVMTSATWPPNVQSLADRYMSNPIQVYIGSLNLAAVHSVFQTILVIDEDSKKDYLLDVLGEMTEDDKVIVFVGKKKMADDLSCDLSLQRILCQCIHGDREQIDREQALEDLKTGEVRILIATDVASRGLDICDITKVVNYDFPRNIEEYVHRVGRTGRAGKTGEAITFFTRADWAYAGELIAILEEANQGVPGELYAMRDRYADWQKRRADENPSGGRFGGNNRRGGRNPRSGHW